MKTVQYRNSPETNKELISLLNIAPNHKVTICGLVSPKAHIKDCILRSLITGCTITDGSYNFDCTGSIWDNSEYEFNNARLEMMSRD
jgi:hypothetical protein